METQGSATCLRTLVCDNVGDFHHDGDAVNYGVEGGIERDDAPAARSRNKPYSIFCVNFVGQCRSERVVRRVWSAGDTRSDRHQPLGLSGWPH